MAKIIPAQMSPDASEEIRRHEVARLNRRRQERDKLERVYGQVWSTDELCKQFEVLGFMAPYVQVRDLDTREKGTLKFQHEPRYYFGWRASHRQRRD